MENHSKRKKPKTVTFRLDEDIVNSLYEEADTDSISLNSLVNSVLRRYIEWHKYERKSNIMPLVCPVVKGLFNHLDEEEVRILAKDAAKDAVYNVILFMYGKVDIDTVICWFKEKMKHCSDISDKKYENIDSRKIIFRHEIGENWSLYNKILLESLCNDVLSKPIMVDITRSTIKIEIK
ncbi:MAG: hypothetical protein ACTHKJ_07260 [Candidatus Nitrosocosmicus sp.]